MHKQWEQSVDTWRILVESIEKNVKRIMRYIRGTSNVALCYGGSEFTVRGYVDSDFVGDLYKRKSTTSYVFILTGTIVR